MCALPLYSFPALTLHRDVKYTDKAGDVISVKSEEEFKFMLTEFKDMPAVRLQLTRKRHSEVRLPFAHSPRPRSAINRIQSTRARRPFLRR